MDHVMKAPGLVDGHDEVLCRWARSQRRATPKEHTAPLIEPRFISRKQGGP